MLMRGPDASKADAMVETARASSRQSSCMWQSLLPPISYMRGRRICGDVEVPATSSSSDDVDEVEAIFPRVPALFLILNARNWAIFNQPVSISLGNPDSPCLRRRGIWGAHFDTPSGMA
jgi:hypothetical protein